MLSTTWSADLVDPDREKLSEELFERIDYHFSDRMLFDLAMTHRSRASEQGSPSNERLEFLGDAVLGLAIADELYRSAPQREEGHLAKARSAVVDTESLSSLARSLSIGPLLLLGRGEVLSEGWEKSSILEDATEALFGAIYLDSDIETAMTVVKGLLSQATRRALDAPGVLDFKTRLQELAAVKDLSHPEYATEFSGPDHDRTFVARVVVGEVVGQGQGSSKKQAQQSAAQAALALLHESSSVGAGRVTEGI